MVFEYFILTTESAWFDSFFVKRFSLRG